MARKKDVTVRRIWPSGWDDVVTLDTAPEPKKETKDA